MSYIFIETKVGAFRVYKATPSIGTTHKKRFKSGVTPNNQATINLYGGKFAFAIPSIRFYQELEAGQSSLDLLIEEFPVGEVCEEYPLENEKPRYCVQPIEDSQKWRRYKKDITEPLTTPIGSVVFTVSGTIIVNNEIAELYSIKACEIVSGTGTVIVMELI